ncbi:MAG: HAMP domain-containing histidine kinase [Lachnospiraceae bacterium]|nr:HAMP domain-containing histidine kinase [Lachnospiraceae bacterium]
MPIEPQGGLPGEFLLLFTLVIWMLFFIIRLGNPQNMLNRWCFISGMIFSLGVLKEYLYFTLGPELLRAFPSLFTESSAFAFYSLLTAIFYYFSMPSALVFGMYFGRVDEHCPRLFSWLKPCVFIPGILMGFLYPYPETRYFQLHVRTFFPIITAYNLAYALVLTWQLLCTLYRERLEPYYHQKKTVAVLVLLPIWYWILSALLVHSLNLRHFFKAWQGNFLILLFLLVYFLCRAFRGGIMGTRFRHEVFEWDKDGQMMSQSARCIRHLCKNELAKIDWCAKNLTSSHSQTENDEYAHIILRSTEHLKNCVEKMQYYSQEIHLKRERCSLRKLFASCADGFSRLHPEISLEILCGQDLFLHCDRAAMLEVFNNLINNAVDAMNGSGRLSIKALPSPGQSQLNISFTDTGKGIPPDLLPRLFAPYFTTKSSSDGHMGLGLYFCQRVVKKHGGRITVDSTPDAGSVFSLNFPWKYVEKGSGGKGQKAADIS